uniref:NADH-ubiquinone oxidoreductase chain 4L n=1 Tax=Anthribidae sp. 2 ACP-2013 TaxID=1434429 RepID=A0A3G3MEE4_9CUCU|nr:NADH dehydrogenase subunit 4L [Anthribidae sp. 2 ACP-2013]
MLIFMLVYFMFMSGVMMFSFQRKHFLIMLLSLEFMVISLYLFYSILFSFLDNEFFFLMIFLTLSVCEGALGLSILVFLIRSFGNDFMLSFFFLW